MRTLRIAIAVVLMAGLATTASGAPTRSVAIEAAGHKTLDLSQNGDTVTVTPADGSPALVGDVRHPGKRKYRLQSGEPVAEVKSREETAAGDDRGFKIKSPDGKLLWKVKIGADKIKIAASDEGTNAWEISLKHADKVKVTDPTGHEAGSVRYHAGSTRVEVRDAADHEVYSASTDLRSSLFAILLMKDLPPRDKQILMAELLARGY
jgi:hypothetical protein